MTNQEETMQTGYGNLWIHRNRHEHLLSLVKNDIYSQAVLTDNYKQVASGGRPGYFNNHMQPQYNISSPQQNDQSKVTSSQCLWPPSVHSLPFRSSQANNFHPPEAFSTQSNSVGHPFKNSQLQQNRSVSYMNNRNVTMSQLYNNFNNCYTKCSKHSTLGAKKSENINQRTPKIGTRDTFSLNNNNRILNSMLEDTSYHPQSSQWDEGVLNYSKANCNKINSAIQTELPIYENIDSPPTNQYHSLYHGPRAMEQPLQFFQHSDSSYQQNAQLLRRNQCQLIDKNLPLNTFKRNSSSSSLKRTLINLGIVQKPNVQSTQKNSCDELLRNKKKILPKQVPTTNFEATGNTHYGKSVNKSSICDPEVLRNFLTAPVNHMEKVPEGNNASLVKYNHSCNTLTSNNLTHVTSETSNPSSQTDGDGRVIKITNPQTSTGGFINLKGTVNLKENSRPSLPCLLENNKLNERIAYHQINSKETEVMDLSLPQNGNNGLADNQTPTIENYACSSSQNLSTSNSCHNYDCTQDSEISFSSNRFYQKDLFIELRESVNQDDLSCDKFSNSFGSKICDKDKNNTTEVVSQTDLDVLEVKQEDRADNDREQENRIETPRIELDGNISEVIMTTEKNPEYFAIKQNQTDVLLLEEQSSLEETTSPETLSPTTQDTEIFDYARINDREAGKSGPEIEKPSTLKEDIGKATQEETDNLKNISNSKGDELELKKKKRASSQKKKYQSSINRDKLDMLIQFLEKDEEPNETIMCEERDLSFCLNREKNDKSSGNKNEFCTSHNRRKLSKTHIVKNKNNTREMISLMSHKILRAELCKDLPKSSVAMETNSDSNQSKGSSEEEKSNDFSEKLLKINNPLPVAEKNEIPEPEWKHKIGKEVSPEASTSVQEEKDIINIMRVFQKLQTYFCMSCDLVSPIESFWINVASGELRCLNCFKKMTLKTEADILNSIISAGSFYSNIVQNDGTENEESEEDIYERNIEKFLTKELLSDAQYKPGRKIISEEEIVSANESENLKKKDLIGKEQPFKELISDKNQEVAIKSEKSIRKKIFEEKEILEHFKTKKKESSSQTRNRSNWKDEISSHKILLSEYHSEKEEKQAVKSLGKCVKKAKERFDKEIETGKMSAEQEASDYSKLSRTLKESSSAERLRPEEHKKLWEWCSTNESKLKSPKGSEKSIKIEFGDQPRKRKSSHEDLRTHKIRIVEDYITKETKSITHSSDKTKITTVTKEGCSECKNKIFDMEKQNPKNFSDKFNKNSSSKEEELNKETKQLVDILDKIKTKEVDYQKIKSSEPKKQRESGSTDLSRRKSREELTDQKMVHSKEQQKQLVESTNKRKKRNASKEWENGSFTEAKKQFFKKVQNISESDKSEQIAISSENFEQSRKLETAKKLSKEKLSIKMSATSIEKSKHKEPHDDKKEPKKILEDKNEQKTDEKVKKKQTNKKEANDKSDKKKLFADFKRQTESRHVEDMWMTVARKKEEEALKDCQESHKGSRQLLTGGSNEKDDESVLELVG